MSICGKLITRISLPPGVILSQAHAVRTNTSVTAKLISHRVVLREAHNRNATVGNDCSGVPIAGRVLRIVDFPGTTEVIAWKHTGVRVIRCKRRLLSR